MLLYLEQHDSGSTVTPNACLAVKVEKQTQRLLAIGVRSSHRTMGILEFIQVVSHAGCSSMPFLHSSSSSLAVSSSSSTC